ncbi:MAG TPA: hypothetical protein VMS56_09735 [Thermoanaerobaculia bacterium]|nr:hypothetical protein [Thermoanaerobaculia bacterium]
MSRTGTAFLISLIVATAAGAEVTAGLEGSEDRGLGFLTWAHPIPVGSDEAIVPWITASYLWYRSFASGGETEVRAPGLGAGVLYRWRPGPRLALAIGPGYEYRWARRHLPGGAEIADDGGGAVFHGSLGYLISARTQLAASANYYGASEWIWSRASVRQEITPSLRAGPEIGYQGNDEVRVREIGGIVEIPYGRNWVFVRAGQAREDYGGGREQTRPYFSAGISRAF